MNLLKFIESFTDDKLYAAGTSRRDSFSQFGTIGKGLALASVPFGLSALGNKAFAADITTPPATAAGALQLALTLEYLEDRFYADGLDSGVIPTADRPTFELIALHEDQHVNFLTTAMTQNGVTIPAIPEFDFTVGGALDPFNVYEHFLILAQAFEDTGVRAYKGQAGNLFGTPFLTPALQIHSVEARHAAQVRRLREKNEFSPGNKGWITLNQRGVGMPDVTQPVYDGEQSTALGAGQFTAEAQSEAYDETMSGDTAVTIANLFIV